MSNNKRFKKLLEPGYIGTVRTKMRLIKTGANPGFFEYEDGNVPQQIIDYYEVLLHPKHPRLGNTHHLHLAGFASSPHQTQLPYHGATYLLTHKSEFPYTHTTKSEFLPSLLPFPCFLNLPGFIHHLFIKGTRYYTF